MVLSEKLISCFKGIGHYECRQACVISIADLATRAIRKNYRCSLPPLNALRVFEAAARLGSFSARGRGAACHATPPSAARSGSSKAGSAGQLFEREARGVQPDQGGARPRRLGVRRLRARSRRRAPHCGATTGSGRIAVGCIPSIASRWLVPMLAAFSAAHPDIRCRCSTPRRNSACGDGEYDVLITLGEDSSGDVERRRLFSRASKPVCSPHYLARIGQARDAAGDPREAQTCCTTKAAPSGRTGSQPPASSRRASCAARCSRISTCSARRSLPGMASRFVPVDVVRKEIARGDLVVLSERTILDDRSYAIFTRKPIRRPAASSATGSWPRSRGLDLGAAPCLWCILRRRGFASEASL